MLATAPWWSHSRMALELPGRSRMLIAILPTTTEMCHKDLTLLGPPASLVEQWKKALRTGTATADMWYSEIAPRYILRLDKVIEPGSIITLRNWSKNDDIDYIIYEDFGTVTDASGYVQGAFDYMEGIEQIMDQEDYTLSFRRVLHDLIMFGDYPGERS